MFVVCSSITLIALLIYEERDQAHQKFVHLKSKYFCCCYTIKFVIKSIASSYPNTFQAEFQTQNTLHNNVQLCRRCSRRSSPTPGLVLVGRLRQLGRQANCKRRRRRRSTAALCAKPGACNTRAQSPRESRARRKCRLRTFCARAYANGRACGQRAQHYDVLLRLHSIQSASQRR